MSLKDKCLAYPNMSDLRVVRIFERRLDIWQRIALLLDWTAYNARTRLSVWMEHRRIDHCQAVMRQIFDEPS